MKTTLTTILAFVMSVGFSCISAQAGRAQSSNRADKRETKEKVYDGGWWLAGDSDERSGFLDGAADCLTSVAHAKWLSHSVQGLDAKISEYYKTHPQDTGMNVADVWRQMLSESQPTKPAPGGEVWTNPHGYYDGLWWRQGSESENRGFLEGYLWCMRTSVNQPSETYSRPISYYADKISAYIQTHPKADGEAVATILSRFRDRPKPASMTHDPKATTP